MTEIYNEKQTIIISESLKDIIDVENIDNTSENDINSIFIICNNNFNCTVKKFKILNNKSSEFEIVLSFNKNEFFKMFKLISSHLDDFSSNILELQFGNFKLFKNIEFCFINSTIKAIYTKEEYDV